MLPSPQTSEDVLARPRFNVAARRFRSAAPPQSGDRVKGIAATSYRFAPPGSIS